MSRFIYLFFILAFFIFLISLVGLFFFKSPIQTNILYTSVNVSDIIGFDVNESALIFGSVQKDGSSMRRVFLENGYSFPIIVEINAEGNIEPLLAFEENVRVESGETKKIPVSVISSGIDEGFYSGNVIFRLFKTSD